jgi:hypothetical protein
MPITHLTDFSDRLSPMLVKELRQGMRARSFTMLFLVFQLLLCFILLSAGAAYESNGAGSFASGIIFTLFGIAVLFMQPMRGLSALSSEITGNTIEMMALTRLSAARIVFGKWIAIVSQSALILVSIIPYLILRYFFGGMVVVGELVFLALMFMTSMALTAVMVGLSGSAAKFARVIPLLGFIFLVSWIPRFLYGSRFSSSMSAFTLSDWESRLGVISYVCFILYAGWCALSHGISAIAPAAENHSTLRRLIALGLAGIAAAVGLHQEVDPHAALGIFAVIISPAIITALTEPSLLLPPICTPFLKRGFIGRVASFFLLPGWPSGVFYTVVLAAVTLAGVAASWATKTHPRFEREAIIGCLACFGAVTFSALGTVYFCKDEKKRFTSFIICLLASVVLTIVPTIFSNINHHEDLLWLFVWNPPVLIPMIGQSSLDGKKLLTAAIIINSIYLGLLMISALIAFRKYRDVIQEAENGIAHTATAA